MIITMGVDNEATEYLKKLGIVSFDLTKELYDEGIIPPNNEYVWGVRTADGNIELVEFSFAWDYKNRKMFTTIYNTVSTIEYYKLLTLSDKTAKNKRKELDNNQFKTVLELIGMEKVYSFIKFEELKCYTVSQLKKLGYSIEVDSIIENNNYKNVTIRW